jgi:superfamily I DNA/RNA helicase
LLRAKYLAKVSKPNLQIVVFTRALRKFIASGTEHYGVPVDRIVTSTKWANGLLYSYGIKPTPPEGFPEQRAYYAESMLDLVDSKKLSNLYDAILLDEAQDYTPAEIKMFAKLGKHLYAVADSRQKIYSGDDPLAALKGVVEKVHPLKSHYRCGEAICRLADALAKDSTEYEPLCDAMMYDEVARPSSVIRHQGNLKEQCAAMAKSLSAQLRAYPTEFLGVVSPKNDGLKEIWEQLSTYPDIANELCLIKADDEAFDMRRRICVCSIHDAKGLELRTLHIADAEMLKRFQHQRNMAFTAVTRAKTSLGIYHKDELPGFFEAAIQSLSPEPPAPSIDALFARSE